MTTPGAVPAQPPPSTGDEREDQAALRAAEVAAILAAATAAILAALAAAIAAVVAGSLSVQMAKRKIRRTIAATLGAASAKLGPVYRKAAEEAQAGGERAGTPVPKGIEKGLPPGTHTGRPRRRGSPSLPDAPEQISRAILAAQQDAGQAFDAAMAAALGGKGSPLPPPGSPYHDAVEKAMRRLTGMGVDVKDLSGPERVRLSLSRLQAAQHVMDELAGKGLTGFTDSAGRRWSLDAYAEMATRTAASRMHLSSQLSAMAQAGNDLVIVDNPGMTPSCPRCAPYEGQILSLSGKHSGISTITDADGFQRTAIVKGSLADAVAHGLLHPSCFPAEVLVSASSRVRAADARWYEGDLIVIHTAGGDELPVTPNHPVLTPEGWVAAGTLKIGQDVVRYDAHDQRVDAVDAGMRPDHHLISARISDVFDALRKASDMPPVRVPASAEQFHGDGGNSDVRVVFADGFLEDHRDAESVGERTFFASGSGLRELLGQRQLDPVLMSVLTATIGFMGRSGQRASAIRPSGLQPSAHGLAATDLNSSVEQVLADGGLGDPVLLGDLGLSAACPVHGGHVGDLVGRLAPMRPDAGSLELAMNSAFANPEHIGNFRETLTGTVSFDRIIGLGRRQIAAHVYNLQTMDGWYAANGIVVHNCRHSLIPWTEGAGAVATAGGKERGYVQGGQPFTRSLPITGPPSYKDEQKLRAHERAVRRDHARVSSALTPQARARARQRLAVSQGALQDHVKATGVLRQPYREKPYKPKRTGPGGAPPPSRGPGGSPSPSRPPRPSGPPSAEPVISKGPLAGFSGRKFSGNKQAADYLDSVKPKLSPDQDTALSYYTGDGFQKVNAALRQGDASRDPETIRLLDSAMTPTQDDLIATRRVDASAFGLPDSDIGKVADLRGKTISDQAYMSTSLGSPYGGGLGGVTMHLAVPKGTPALPASPFSSNPHETELLLGRGTQVAISRVEKNPQTFAWEVWGVVVPEGES